MDGSRGEPRGPESEGALLLRTWDDGEAAIIRHLLESYGIPVQVVSDVPHAVLPLAVDGLGEVRIRVPESRLGDAERLLAEHRRQGLRVLPGGRSSRRPSAERPGRDRKAR